MVHDLSQVFVNSYLFMKKKLLIFILTYYNIMLNRNFIVSTYYNVKRLNGPLSSRFIFLVFLLHNIYMIVNRQVVLLCIHYKLYKVHLKNFRLTLIYCICFYFLNKMRVKNCLDLYLGM